MTQRTPRAGGGVGEEFAPSGGPLTIQIIFLMVLELYANSRDFPISIFEVNFTSQIHP